MFGIKQYISSISKESKEIDASHRINKEEQEESPDEEGLIHLDIKAKIPFTTTSGLKSVKTYEQPQEQCTGCVAEFWIGLVVGIIVTLLTAASIYIAWMVLKKHVSRRRTLDLDDMSESPFVRNYKTNNQVYVKLSNLHSPRRSPNSQYVISMMDRSNNFSIDSDTSSSSEEEIYCLSERTPNVSPLIGKRVNQARKVDDSGPVKDQDVLRMRRNSSVQDHPPSVQFNDPGQCPKEHFSGGQKSKRRADGLTNERPNVQHESPPLPTTKLTLTSTPIKTKENVTRSLPTTPTKGIHRSEVKLPISPLALEKVTSK